MKLGWIVAALLLLALPGCKPGPASGQSGDEKPDSRRHSHTAAHFDFYLLNLSWSPEFCYSHPTAAECAQHATFVLHGLWPENNDGSYPENCSNAPGPADPSQFNDIFPDPGLLQHEWKTHGTCSGLLPEDYFAAARKAFQSVRIPPQLSNLKNQASLPPDQIIGLFSTANPQISSSAFAVTCGHNFLTAIEECLDKNLQPVACSSVRSCRANIVRISPP